jgi:hypothetical protein
LLQNFKQKAPLSRFSSKDRESLRDKHAKPLKVIIPNSKNDKKLNSTQTSSSSCSSTPLTSHIIIDNDRMLRLFVVIPKDFCKKDLRDVFEVNFFFLLFKKITIFLFFY